MEDKKITCSLFYFDIVQDIASLMFKIKQLNGKRWRIEGQEEYGRFLLVDLKHEDNIMQVYYNKMFLKFVTASGYQYTIWDKSTTGAEVCFVGPVNALLRQSMMPYMTYVPNTLEGKYADMEDSVPIRDYMAIRAERHQEDVNPQDAYGWRVNRKFNNELTPFFPAFDESKRKQPTKGCDAE